MAVVHGLLLADTPAAFVKPMIATTATSSRQELHRMSPVHAGAVPKSAGTETRVEFDGEPRSSVAKVMALATVVTGAGVAAQTRRRARARRFASNIIRAACVAEAGKTTDTLPEAAQPLNIAIAGGGVGGLVAAFALLKQGYNVTVYEKTGKFARFGGPIQFASNATSTLKAIDERLFQRIMNKFTFTATRRCGIKDGLRADGSFRITDPANPAYLWDEKVAPDWYMTFPLKECADFFKLPYTGVINRPDLQDILLDECKLLNPSFIENGNGIVSYENHDAGVTITLADGTTREADILIGADGIWSQVRAQMYKEGEVKKKSPDGKSIQKCRYSGYSVFAGEAVMKPGDYYECGYKVYIGPGKYFVTSDVGDGRIQWYAFLGLPPGTKRANDTWEGSQSSSEQGKDVISYVKSLHEGWSSEIFYVLDRTPAQNVEQRDLYDRNPEFFRSWADGSVVLMGDAVHPMMPNLGQGGCQAIEDAFELSRVLASVGTYSSKPSQNELRNALQEFYRRRVFRVAAISTLSRVASDLIINAFDTPWSPHEKKEPEWRSFFTFAFKPILQFVIFPLQFLFLYSFHPSGGMGDLPKQLVAEWQERHKTSSEAAFERVAREGQSVASPSFFAKAEQ